MMSKGNIQKTKNLEDAEEDDEEEKYSKNQGLRSISQHSMSIKGCESIMIVDGAYFEIGVKDLESKNPSQKCLSVPENIENLLSFIEKSTEIQSFQWKSFHSAEEPKAKKRKAYYSVLEENGFVFDIREFKSKKVKCPNNNCKHFNKAFVTKVQAEVDVAITMTTMKLLLANPTIKNIVFIIGDRDFIDLFHHVKDTNINTWVFGFRANLSSHIFEVFPPDRIIYINDYWNSDITSKRKCGSVHVTNNQIKNIEPIETNFKKSTSELSKLKPSIEKEQSTTAKKKKKKKNKNANKKEEEKKGVKNSINEQSHSSTDDSRIEKISKPCLLYILYCSYFV